jgi:5-methylcytosine-specific restriction endonuclease McrA
MARKPPSFYPRGKPVALKTRKAEHDKRRGSARKRGYTGAWDRAAKGHLAHHPLCRYCELGAFAEPQIKAADTVDHFWPHAGDRDLFWRSEFWVSCCADCHNGPKQSAERSPTQMRRLARLLCLPNP